MRTKRPRKTIELLTQEDASLWQYRDVGEALAKNIDILAKLARTDLSPTLDEPIVSGNTLAVVIENPQSDET